MTLGGCKVATNVYLLSKWQWNLFSFFSFLYLFIFYKTANETSSQLLWWLDYQCVLLIINHLKPHICWCGEKKNHSLSKVKLWVHARGFQSVASQIQPNKVIRFWNKMLTFEPLYWAESVCCCLNLPRKSEMGQSGITLISHIPWMQHKSFMYWFLMFIKWSNIVLKDEYII